MALSDYSELVDGIVDMARRAGDADFAAGVDMFITLAHSRINRELRCREMVKQTTISLTNGVGDLPDDYLDFIEVKSGTSVMANVDPNFGDWTYPQGATNCARYFAIIGTTIKTWPSVSSVNLLYHGEIEHPQNAADNSNWLLRKCPGLYLYGSMLEAMPFMQDDERIVTWATFYERLRDSLKADDVVSRYARSSSRVRGPTP